MPPRRLGSGSGRKSAGEVSGNERNNLAAAISLFSSSISVFSISIFLKFDMLVLESGLQFENEFRLRLSTLRLG